MVNHFALSIVALGSFELRTALMYTCITDITTLDCIVFKRLDCSMVALG